MPPLQGTLRCPSSNTGIVNGPSGNQYKDKYGFTNEEGGRPDERKGFQGSFTHGVTIYYGGVPRDVPFVSDYLDHGIVLNICPNIAPDLSDLPTLKPGTDERFSYSNRFVNRAMKHKNVAVLEEDSNHGTVLNTCPNLKPNFDYLGKTNVIGERPTERLSLSAGFNPGLGPLMTGRKREYPKPKTYPEATVLYTSDKIHPNLSQVPCIKDGTEDERYGRIGSFETGVNGLAIHMPTKEDAELWVELGQKGGRRFSQGHFIAGVTTLAGTHPVYDR
mmetsp:Transcript_20558/g.30438  ORF Transcript_20558/g.30438 Transcript_20558/m.30438 type:complete len:275 (-) Transcript_20558:145-969(-)|eukprot:CAMPEP_0171451550 /NCGR_PEP_ID=MMETSP0945-20130129/16_1 /TAXON_ID=109269 /ORGANISM="Vaucheria litorea, Strain CCMP2940" /LENGTH=274 /DNA_ID=CAMNT_0011976045 /DNA_START=44 /DNA_END=868 /DNA_ORIENTATION=-